MKLVAGIDLGSTTTKAILLDLSGNVLGRGITNSRSNYHLATKVALDEAKASARFELIWRRLDRELRSTSEMRARLEGRYRQSQYLASLRALRAATLEEAIGPRYAAIETRLSSRLRDIFDELEERELSADPGLRAGRPLFFRDEAASEYGRAAHGRADEAVPFDLLMGLFDKAICRVENRDQTDAFSEHIGAALGEENSGPDDRPRSLRDRGVSSGPDLLAAIAGRVLEEDLEPVQVIGTGYGRQRLPFERRQIRSEILCHGLGAHALYPGTRTVLDIGGQDTKAIQVDGDGIVTSFQMNDRCAAGCGRYLGYIADEMSLGVHELGPLALAATRRVKITSTCTVFAGAELRDRLTLGQRREDILAGLHRAVILRAMALLARSGGVSDELTFTGGVASNPAAVGALRELVAENYGDRTINISPDSIYMGALGAALFALRSLEEADGPAREALA